MRHMLLVPLILGATLAMAPPAHAEAAAVAKPAEVRTVLPPTAEQQARAARAVRKVSRTTPVRVTRSALAPKPWQPKVAKPAGIQTIRTKPEGPMAPEQLHKTPLTAGASH
jgi:hypothetical protein